MIPYQEKLHKFLLPLLIALTAIAGVLVFIHPMAIFPDPSWGFQVMRSMENGAGFNLKVSPDQQNMADNYGEFLSWWSPGQYLLPYLFKSLFKLNIGQACAVTIVVCEVLGLLGFYNFFRKAGFTKAISAMSTAFIASQLFYVTPFVFYNGGEVLLFGFGGWFLYGCLKFTHPKSWQMVVFVLISGWISFFCKSSFMWVYAAGLWFIWIRTSRMHRFLGKWLINAIWLAAPAATSFAVIYFGYLSKGHTPASGGAGLKLLWETFAFPLASPLISGFSIDELVHGFLYHPDGALFTYANSVAIIAVLAAGSIFVIHRILKTVPNRDYCLMLIVFYVISVLFFSVSFLRQLAISYEGRHFRMMGLLFIPGAIYLVSELIKPYRALFGLLWAFILCSSLTYLVNGYRVNRYEGAHGTSGLTQQFLDQDAVDEIIKLDNTSKNAVFVFISPDLGLEIKHNRFITLDPIDQKMAINYEDYQHCGHSGPLYIFLPSAYKGAKATMILKSFEDYKGFHFTQLSEDYVLFAAK